MGRGSGNRKEWQQKNKEDKAAAEAEAAAAEAEEDEDELLLQDEERPSLLTRSHRLLQRLLLSTGWELFMCSSIVLYCVGMGSADIDVEWKKLQWSSIVDTFAFLYSFVVGMLEALLRMLAFGVGLRKKKDDGRAARLPQLTEAQARFVDDTFNLLDTKGLGTLDFREFRVALRDLGRDKGLYLFENETKKLFDEVAALQPELRSLRVHQSILHAHVYRHVVVSAEYVFPRTHTSGHVHRWNRITESKWRSFAIYSDELCRQSRCRNPTFKADGMRPTLSPFLCNSSRCALPQMEASTRATEATAPSRKS